jgi:hypothetical protein
MKFLFGYKRVKLFFFEIQVNIFILYDIFYDIFYILFDEHIDICFP